jgi:hypothetical protein
METVGIGGIEGEDLAVDLLRLQQAAGLMKR